MKICIFCSASKTLERSFYDSGEHFGNLLGMNGLDVVFGGYADGLMGRVANAAAEFGTSVTAVVPDCFNWNGYALENTDVIHTDSIRNRKQLMEELADGFAVLPGGIGTMDEFFDMLVMTAQGNLHKPIAVLNHNEIYDDLEKLLDIMVRKGFLSAEIAGLVHFFTDEEAMVSYLCKALHEN